MIAGRLREIFFRLPGERRNALFGCRDLILAREDAESRVVAALVAVLQPDQLATVACCLVAEHVVGRWFDAERILSGLQVLPLIHAGKLILAGDDFEADAERVVDDGNRSLA